VPEVESGRPAAEPGRYAMSAVRQLIFGVICLLSINGVPLSVSAQQSGAGPPFESSDELLKVATELVELVEPKHSCDLAIYGTPRLDGSSDHALVWVTTTGDQKQCMRAIADLMSYGGPLRIVFSPVEGPPQHRNDNLTLLHEVIE
jgi:hypothetical protein